MLRDTGDRLLCPECGGALWVGVNQFSYNPAFYDAETHDHIDHEEATRHGVTDTTYTGLWCQQCKWMTRQVDEYLEEA